jgi:hypothetical protein
MNLEGFYTHTDTNDWMNMNARFLTKSVGTLSGRQWALVGVGLP